MRCVGVEAEVFASVRDSGSAVACSRERIGSLARYFRRLGPRSFHSYEPRGSAGSGQGIRRTNFTMNLPSEAIGIRARGGSRALALSLFSPEIGVGDEACKYVKLVKLVKSTQSGFGDSAGVRSLRTTTSDFAAPSSRRARRKLSSAASFGNEEGITSDSKNGSAGSHLRQTGILHSGSDPNCCALGRLDPKAEVSRVLDRRANADGNAVVLVAQGWRRGNSFLLTRDDSPHRSNDYGRSGPYVATQKSSVLPEKAIDASKQLCVAVDVDEVLGSFLATLNLFILETYSEQYNLSQYYIYDFMKIWKCTQSEANNRVHKFFDSDHFKNGITPIPGAHQALLQLASSCQFVVVTSRQHVIKDKTLEWIEQYYAGIFKEVHFGNHFALEGPSRRKSEICRSLGARVLIDDNPRYALECAESGIEVLLFDLHGGYPWSKTPCGPQHPLITRVRNWQEVERALLARICVTL